MLQGEYTAKAMKADRQYGNTIEEQLEQILLSFGRVCGLAVGAWGEISEDFNCLMDVMGEKKVEELEAQTGRDFRKLVSAQLTSYISQNRQ